MSCNKHCCFRNDCLTGFAHCDRCPGTDLPAPYTKIRYTERGYDFDGQKWVASSSSSEHHDPCIRVCPRDVGFDYETFEDVSVAKDTET